MNFNRSVISVWTYKIIVLTNFTPSRFLESAGCLICKVFSRISLSVRLFLVKLLK